jgi:hypothetical protein
LKIIRRKGELAILKSLVGVATQVLV